MVARLNIIVVEDNQDLRLAIVDVLKADGHRVIGVDSAEAVPEMLTLGFIDLMVIDLNLPGEDGLSLMRRVRESHPQMGIILSTARALEEQKIEGYESGADMYLIKPVAMAELLAATHAISRRLKLNSPASAHQVPDTLTLHASRLVLTGPTGLTVGLSAAEVALLSGFALAGGQRLEKWQILTLLKRDAAHDQMAAVELVLVRLRKKIKQVGIEQPSIKVIRNWGYQLCVSIRSVGG